MQGYTHRKGMIRNRHDLSVLPFKQAFKQAYVPTSHRSYGAVIEWRPSTKQLSRCAGVREAYVRYMSATQKLDAVPYARRLGRTASAYRELQRKYKREGKAAWKACSRTTRYEEGEARIGEEELSALERMQQWSTGVTGGEDIDSGEYDPGYPVATAYPQYEVPPAPPAPPVGEPPYTDEREPPNLLMWGGVAAGAAVLWMLLRK